MKFPQAPLGKTATNKKCRWIPHHLNQQLLLRGVTRKYLPPTSECFQSRRQLHITSPSRQHSELTSGVGSPRRRHCRNQRTCDTLHQAACILKRVSRWMPWWHTSDRLLQRCQSLPRSKRGSSRLAVNLTLAYFKGCGVLHKQAVCWSPLILRIRQG